MKKILAITIAASLALSGCATTGGASPFGLGQAAPGTAAKPQVSQEQKAEARRGALKSGLKGCGLGVAMGALSSIIGGGVNAKALLAGCAVGGTTAGITAYQSQLADFRALQGKVTVGAVVTVKEKDVVVEGKTVKAPENLTLNLDAEKVRTHHEDIKVVLTQLSVMLNKQTGNLTMTVRGSATDTAWILQELKGKLTNAKVTVKTVAGPAPVIVVNPLPVME